MDNQSIDEQRIMGLPKGLELKQFERTDELNLRLLERNEPQYPLAPNFTPRPVLTKYSLFPILDARMPCNVDIEAKDPRYGGNPNCVIATPDIKCFKIRNNYDFIIRVNPKSRSCITTMPKASITQIHPPRRCYRWDVPTKTPGTLRNKVCSRGKQVDRLLFKYSFPPIESFI